MFAQARSARIIDALTLALVGVLVYVSASAATTATVSATATVQNVSVSVADGTVSYGTMSSNTSASTIAADLNDTQVATNNGNITEDLNIRGTDSAGWTLAGTAGSDQYVHRFCTSSCGSPPTNFTALTTSYQTLATGVTTSATRTFELRITTPNPSTVFTQQSVDVTIQAVAP